MFDVSEQSPRKPQHPSTLPPLPTYVASATQVTEWPAFDESSTLGTHQPIPSAVLTSVAEAGVERVKVLRLLTILALTE